MIDFVPYLIFLCNLQNLLDFLWQEGVGAICPTIVTCDIQCLRESLETLHEARKHIIPKRCVLLGAHLEGPFISERKK